MRSSKAMKVLCGQMSIVQSHLYDMTKVSYAADCGCEDAAFPVLNPRVDDIIIDFIRDAINHKIKFDQYEKLKKEVEELEDELVVVTNKLKNKKEELNNSYPY